MQSHLHRFIVPAAGALALAAAGNALAQHAGDIGLATEAGAITTHAIDAGGIGAAERVFLATFGDTGSPNFTSNPGFDCVAGTFAVGTRVGFRFAGPLQVWDGATFVDTAPQGPLAGERVRVSFLTANATSGDVAAPGFDLAVQSNGGWHRHLSYTLLAAAGAASPDAGVYLLPLQMYSTDPAVAASQTLLLVMDAGADPQSVADAAAAANALLSPCPADLDGNGVVDGADLGMLLGNWGGAGTGDIDGNGIVNGADLGALHGAFGPCGA
ncbi:MAG: hypothetical protein U0625_04315 [Phycisphaerales bacterium]